MGGRWWVILYSSQLVSSATASAQLSKIVLSSVSDFASLDKGLVDVLEILQPATASAEKKAVRKRSQLRRTRRRGKIL